MKLLMRTTVLALATTFALSACGAEQKPVDVSATTPDSTSAEGGKSYPGLPTEKDQAAYVIGTMMGKQLEDIKDEINMETLIKALRAQANGEKPKLNDIQMQQILQDFGQKMQAKAIASMMEAAKKNAEASAAFLAQNGKKEGVVTTDSGLQYRVMTEGKGAKPTADANVLVHYKGSLLDGTVFDSSYDRGAPAELPLGGVIRGWAEGLQLMPVGSKYTLWIPAELAYGNEAPQAIGPNQVLTFEVELLDIVKPSAQ